ncbi:MAG: hypothetical protein HOW73_40350 [Polyangiaceae bacterium]|nr:hypothetical protein [Polyangiaceae bacterium]
MTADSTDSDARDDTAAPRAATSRRLGGRARQAMQLDAAEPIAFHVTIRLSDDRVIAPASASQRLATKAFIVHGRSRRMLAFRLADTHGHAVLACSRYEAGRFAQQLTTSLRKVLKLSVPFEPSRIRPVEDQRHLMNCIPYVLRQDARHGLEPNPSHECSSLPDLLGLRVFGCSAANDLGAFAPRLKPAALWLECGGVDVTGVEPDLTHLSDAAAAAWLLPNLRSRTNPCVDAKRAAVHAARGQLAVAALARRLGISERTVYRLAAEPCAPDLVRAVTLQMRLRAAIAAREAEP